MAADPSQSDTPIRDLGDDQVEPRRVLPETQSLESQLSAVEGVLPGDEIEEEWVDPKSISNLRRIKLIALAVLLAATFAALIYAAYQNTGSADDITIVDLSPRVRLLRRADEARQNRSKVLVLNQFSINDDVFADIGPMPDVEALLVDKGYLGDASMPAIAKMPKLAQLRLRLSPVTNEGLKSLAESRSIWLLNLPHARCTSQGVRELAKMERLRSLRLGSPQLSGDVARAITEIKTLRTLHLIGVPITDDGLRRIAAMPQLESLYLDDSAVTDAGWRWLFENYGHLHVHIDQEHHDRDPHRHTHR
ncbi:MAG: hypothetical protein AAF958_17455 [Planctomycetota bacterium]